MMTEQSLRPMTLVFMHNSSIVWCNIYNYAELQQIYRILQKILFDFFNNPEQTFIPFRAELLRWIAAFSWKLIFEWGDCCLFINIKTVLSRLLKRGFSRWIRSMHMELLLIHSRKFLFQFLPRPLILNFHSPFWHHIFSTTFAQSHFRR